MCANDIFTTIVAIVALTISWLAIEIKASKDWEKERKRSKKDKFKLF